MSKLPSPTKKSIFDSTENPPEKFWKQRDFADFIGSAPVLESVYYYRTHKFFNDHVTCFLSIRDNFLVFQKKKTDKIVDYIDFEEFMYQFEIIEKNDKRYSSRYRYAFALTANGKSYEFFCKDQAQFQKWHNEFRRFCIMTNFNELYQVGEILGTGGYGKVYLLEENETKLRWAGKYIKVSQAKNIKRQIVMLINEIKILRKLNHPNIVKLHEVHEIDGEIRMVMEYVRGEKLFNHILNKKALNEPETALVLKQLFLSLHHLQMNDVIHRDLKPENILLTKNKAGKTQAKLIDFGLGTFNHKRDIIKKCGTPGYVAPEILNHGVYDFSVDIYSLGIVMMVALTGKPAFQSTNYKELLEKNAKGQLRTKGPSWTNLSKEARSLIHNLTDMDPSLRMSIEEALNHEWFSQNLSKDEFQEIISQDLKLAKQQIPQEEKIGLIPISARKIASANKGGSGSIFDLLSININASQSFITSHYQIERSSNLTLNSFYKGGSKDSSFSDMSSNLSFHPPVSKTYNSIVNNRSFQKDNILGLPPAKANHKTKEGKRRSVSLNVAIANELAGSTQTGEYKIQISAIDSFQEMSFSSDDSFTCGTKYMNLPKNKFSVRKTEAKKLVPQSICFKQLPGKNKIPEKKIPEKMTFSSEVM